MTVGYFVGGAGADTFFSESKYYDTQATQMFGNGGNDFLFGSDGMDLMYGGTGNDYLEDFSGAGKLYGDAGNDTLMAAKGECTLSGGTGDDVFGFSSIVGYGHFDVVGGDAANYGVNAGWDRILAYTDNTVIGLKAIRDIDEIDAQGHTNVTIETNSTATSLDFSSTTLKGIAAINGLGGNDTIIGSAGNDVIFGGWSSGDVINGGAGNDTLKGYGGTLTGGSGEDLFQSVGSVVVTDFNDTQDHIFLPAGSSWAAAPSANGGTVISFSPNNTSMTLLGIAPDQVQASWFLTF